MAIAVVGVFVYTFCCVAPVLLAAVFVVKQAERVVRRDGHMSVSMLTLKQENVSEEAWRVTLREGTSTIAHAAKLGGGAVLPASSAPYKTDSESSGWSHTPPVEKRGWSVLSGVSRLESVSKRGENTLVVFCGCEWERSPIFFSSSTLKRTSVFGFPTP